MTQALGLIALGMAAFTALPSGRTEPARQTGDSAKAYEQQKQGSPKLPRSSAGEARRAARSDLRASSGHRFAAVAAARAGNRRLAGLPILEYFAPLRGSPCTPLAHEHTIAEGGGQLTMSAGPAGRSVPVLIGDSSRNPCFEDARSRRWHYPGRRERTRLGDRSSHRELAETFRTWKCPRRGPKP